MDNLGENEWDFWVYPEKVEVTPPSDIIVTKTLPLFNAFPTEHHTNWQWWDEVVILIPGYRWVRG